MSHNEQCTRPGAISRALQAYPDVRVWLVFMYAEADYPSKLRAVLESEHPDKRFIFEGEVAMNRQFPQDNYFTFLMGKVLSSEAFVNVETHLCQRQSEPKIILGGTVNGLYLMRSASP